MNSHACRNCIIAKKIYVINKNLVPVKTENNTKRKKNIKKLKSFTKTTMEYNKLQLHTTYTPVMEKYQGK